MRVAGTKLLDLCLLYPSWECAKGHLGLEHWSGLGPEGQSLVTPNPTTKLGSRPLWVLRARAARERTARVSKVIKICCASVLEVLCWCFLLKETFLTGPNWPKNYRDFRVSVLLRNDEEHWRKSSFLKPLSFSDCFLLGLENTLFFCIILFFFNNRSRVFLLFFTK